MKRAAPAMPRAMDPPAPRGGMERRPDTPGPRDSEARESRDERSAHRTYPVTATPRDAGFVRTFVVAIVLLLAGTATLNLLVDPLGDFGTGLLPRVTWDDRDEKARLFQDRQLHPALLVIGSSRTMKLDPACAASATGLPAFNFGVSGGRPEDFTAIYRFVGDVSGPSVRRIILGVEPDILLDDVAIGAFARQSRYLGRYVRAEGLPMQELAAALLGQGATVLSLKSLLHTARGGRVEAPPITLRDDGMLFYTRDEAQVREGTFDQRARIAAQIPALRQAFSPGHHLSPERVALLRRLLADARARHILVDAFIPPTHPAAVEELRGTAFGQRLAQTRALLEGLAADGLLVYHETAQGERLGITPDGYFDAYHLMQPNANRLLASILGAPVRCAVQ